MGFAIQPSHKANALNTTELVNASGANAIVNRIGNQSSQTESVGSVPTKFALSQNYPNPFNPVTVIRYELPQASVVKLQVFDVLGRVVATLVNERRDAGIYEAVFNASTLSSGTYFYRLQASTTNGASSSSFVETKKMMLVK
ncbi:MAG: T9SS type A sorting domain-containing protein [Chloroherpetonaceae bacterium]